MRAALAMEALPGAFMAPRSPGSTGNLLLRVCTAGDEVAGGPTGLVDTLTQAARAAGVDIRTGTRVARIVLGNHGTAVEGIELDDGESIVTGRVLATCDPKTTFLSLIGSRWLASELARDIGNVRARGIVAKVHLALSGELHNRAGEVVEAVRIAGGLDSIERAFDPVKYGEFGARPALDIRVPSMSDTALAPAGHHVASILVYFAPHTLRDGWNDDARNRLLEAVLARAGEALPDLRERVVAGEVLTPFDIEEQYGVTGGHLYHVEHALDQLLFMRPTLACSKYATPIAGLYLGGSGSHPGGGLTCLPGYLAAQAMLTAGANG